MTHEEKIEVVRAARHYLCSGNPVWDVDVIYDALTTAIDDMQTVPAIFSEPRRRWIPCSERLPKNGEDVLVTDHWREVRTAYLTNNTVGRELCWVVDHNSYHPVEDNDILAWMPLPEPFRKGSK